MRRIVFSLVGFVALVLCGNQVAMAHDYCHWGYHNQFPHYAYRNWGGAYVAGYGGYGLGYGGYDGYGGYGCGPRYAGYVAPYGYGYPQPAFGVSVPNFSLWFQQ
ncbi:MAG: hypothetical protein HY288_15720 [Planctomycetia bacterium]|nr:hypothetical protein [Planctomycetia bacterium]